MIKKIILNEITSLIDEGKEVFFIFNINKEMTQIDLDNTLLVIKSLTSTASRLIYFIKDTRDNIARITTKNINNESCVMQFNNRELASFLYINKLRCWDNLYFSNLINDFFIKLATIIGHMPLKLLLINTGQFIIIPFFYLF